MLSLRSARGRGVLASAVLILVLVTVAIVAVLRVRQHQHRLLALEDTATAAVSLEHVRGQLFRELAALSGLVFSDDPTLVDDYREAAAALEWDLNQARTEGVGTGRAGYVATLGDVTERIGNFNQTANTAIPLLLEGDPQTRVQVVAAVMPQIWAEVDAIVADLDQLAEDERTELAAERATATNAADVTIWIVVGFGGIALLMATGVVVVIIASVVRPLVSLRASARAITSGDLAARAKVFGPEEVASLARDFNEMTEALSAKTKEYIDTTNLTGDMIAKVDEHGKWAFLNDAACQFFGKPREELLGTYPTALVHPEDVEATVQVVQEGRARTEPVRGFVNRQLTPMGIRVVEWNGCSLFAEDGRYAGIQISGRDITERKRAEEELAGSEERLKILFEAAPDAYYLSDLEGNIVDGNRAAEELLGYKREELIGKNMFEVNLLLPDQISKATEGFAQNAQGKAVGPNEFTLIEKDGNQIAVEIRAFPVKIKDQTLVLGVARDITERKLAEEAVRESEARYRLLAENTSDLIWIMDMGLRYTYMSPSVTRMRGYTVEEIVGASIAETMTPASLEAARKTLAEELAMERMEHKDIHRSRKLELEMYCKDGSTIWTEMNMTFLRDADGKPVGILGVTRDISERKKAEEERERLLAELEVRAITDSLTGLYDHAHFYQRLSEEIDRSKRYNHGFAVVMMDVDDFKRFNDSRGHQAGDEMLRLVADCIRSGVRSSDIAFRYGGDEFAAILPHADSSKARAAVERINGRITKRLKQIDGGSAVRLSLSAGVACFPDDGTAADDLVRLADAALYSAKWVARARDIMGQREDIQSLISALVSRRGGVEGSAGGAIFRPEALHEQQARIVSSVASSIAVALKDAGVCQALEDPDLQVLATVGAAAEIKDRYIRGHPERTSEGAAALAEEMGLSPERVRDIRIAGLLHDIGKVTVSESILNKPGKLTKREFASIKAHPIVGASLVSQVKGFERLVPIVRHHHERFDSKGYPDGLTGEEIPLEARILSVVDVFDALKHQRSYREAMSSEEAMAELERGAGTQFDSAVVEAFLALVKTRGDELTAFAQAASADR